VVINEHANEIKGDLIMQMTKKESCYYLLQNVKVGSDLMYEKVIYKEQLEFMRERDFRHK